MKNVWFLELPAHLYVEDVKDLARKEGLKIIDKRYASKEMIAELGASKVPKVTRVDSVKKES